MKKMLSLSLALVAGAAIATAAITPNNLQGVTAAPQKAVSEKFNKVRKNMSAVSAGFNQGSRLKAEPETKVWYHKAPGTFFMPFDYVTKTGGYPVMYCQAFTRLTYKNVSEAPLESMLISAWYENTSDPNETPYVGIDFPKIYQGGFSDFFPAFEAPTLSLDNKEFSLYFIDNSEQKSPMYIQGGRSAVDPDGIATGMGTFNLLDPSFAGFATLRILMYRPGDAEFTAANLAQWEKLAKTPGAHIESFISTIDKPAEPYILRSVKMNASMFSEAGASLELNVYKRVDGKRGDLLTTSKLNFDKPVFGDDPDTGLIGAGDVQLDFALTSEDEFGFVQDFILVDSEIECELVGFYDDPAIKEFTLLCTISNNEEVVNSAEYNSFVGVYGADKARVGSYDISDFFFPGADGKLHPETENVKQFNIIYDITLPFIGIMDYYDAMDENAQAMPVDMLAKDITYEAKGTDEVVNFETLCSELADNVVITDDNGTDLPDWVAYAIQDVEIQPNSGAFIQIIQFQIKGMPAGLDGRKVRVKIDSNNAVKYITIIQGTGSVNSVTVDALNAVMAGETLELTYPAEVAGAQVFNVAGQLVKDVEFDGTGIAKVDAQDLAKGVYLVKFANNKTVKVIK